MVYRHTLGFENLAGPPVFVGIFHIVVLNASEFLQRGDAKPVLFLNNIPLRGRVKFR